MARSFARWDVSSWVSDLEWRALPPEEQWCYFMLCSQAKLSIAGVIDMKLSVWAGYAEGMTVERLNVLLASLEARRFVVIDRSTEELVIRSFTRHDGCFANRNTGRGVWRSIMSIASPMLRDVVVENLPERAFEPVFEPLFERPSNHCSDSGSNPRSRTEPNLKPEADSPLKGGVQRGENETDAADRFLNEIPMGAM